MAFGTLSTLDTLRSSQQSIAQYGEDRAFEAIAAALAAHNMIVRELVSDFVEITDQRQRRYGGGGGSAMEELDEFGTPSPQKIAAGVTVGFPLRKYGRALQWTRTYFQVATAQEFAAQVTEMMDADAKNIQTQIKRALFKPTNVQYEDRLVDHVQLALKALINADGTAMPVGPNGETFNGSTHTHYLFTAGTTLAAADLDALVTTVTEHYGVGSVKIFINAAQETSIRALNAAGQFTAITPVGVTPAYTSQAVVTEFDKININNRRIGFWGKNWAEIWVKPWMIGGYVFAYVDGAPIPLCMRTRNMQTGTGDFSLMSEDEEHPLRARSYEREFGVAVWNRTNGAATYIDTGAGGAYVAPVIS